MGCTLIVLFTDGLPCCVAIVNANTGTRTHIKQLLAHLVSKQNDLCIFARRSWYSSILIHIRNSGIVPLAAHTPQSLTFIIQKRSSCSSLHAGGYLDFASLPLCVRHSVTVTNALAAAAILANSLDTDVLELEVPATALHSSLCAFGPFFLLTLLLLGDSVLLVFHLGEALQALGTGDVFCVPAFKLDKLRVRNALVCRKQCWGESLSGILTSEVSRLGCRVKQLLSCGGVDGKIVDALVSFASDIT